MSEPTVGKIVFGPETKQGSQLTRALDALEKVAVKPVVSQAPDLPMLWWLVDELDRTFDPGGNLPDDCAEWVTAHLQAITAIEKALIEWGIPHPEGKS